MVAQIMEVYHYRDQVFEVVLLPCWTRWSDLALGVVFFHADAGVVGSLLIMRSLTCNVWIICASDGEQPVIL